MKLKKEAFSYSRQRLALKRTWRPRISLVESTRDPKYPSLLITRRSAAELSGPFATCPYQLSVPFYSQNSATLTSSGAMERA